MITLSLRRKKVRFYAFNRNMRLSASDTYPQVYRLTLLLSTCLRPDSEHGDF